MPRLITAPAQTRSQRRRSTNRLEIRSMVGASRKPAGSRSGKTIARRPPAADTRDGEDRNRAHGEDEHEDDERHCQSRARVDHPATDRAQLLEDDLLLSGGAALIRDHVEVI